MQVKQPRGQRNRRVAPQPEACHGYVEIAVTVDALPLRAGLAACGCHSRKGNRPGLHGPARADSQDAANAPYGAGTIADVRGFVLIYILKTAELWVLISLTTSLVTIYISTNLYSRVRFRPPPQITYYQALMSSECLEIGRLRTEVRTRLPISNVFKLVR
jgi:hypothetical protein